MERFDLDADTPGEVSHPFAGPQAQQVVDVLRCAGAGLGAANVIQGLYLVLRWNAERFSQERVFAMAALTLFSAVTATNEIASLGNPLMWQVPARLTAQILATIAVWRFIRQPQADIIERDRLLELLDEWGSRVRERERERSRNQLLDLIEERLTDPRGVPQVRKQDPPR